MTQRPGEVPSPAQVTELLDGEFARLGYEIENVVVDVAARPPRVRVVIDGDTPVDLETAAELSRSASSLLDALDTGAYLLEVSSPGVDRPLTAEKHFRRARGRKVVAELADTGQVTGRIAAVGDGAVDLVMRDAKGWTRRRIPLSEIRTAVVQVEFSPPSAEELELVSEVQM